MAKPKTRRAYTTVSVTWEAREIIVARAKKNNDKKAQAAEDLIRAGAAVLSAREGTR